MELWRPRFLLAAATVIVVGLSAEAAVADMKKVGGLALGHALATAAAILGAGAALGILEKQLLRQFLKFILALPGAVIGIFFLCLYSLVFLEKYFAEFWRAGLLTIYIGVAAVTSVTVVLLASIVWRCGVALWIPMSLAAILGAITPVALQALNDALFNFQMRGLLTSWLIVVVFVPACLCASSGTRSNAK